MKRNSIKLEKKVYYRTFLLVFTSCADFSFPPSFPFHVPLADFL